MRTILRMAFVVPLACYGLAAGAATTTGMDFVGGCNKTLPTDVCDRGGNASSESIAAILSVDESLVTYLGPARIDRHGNIVLSGSKHDLSQSDITHLAFKSSTYHIVGEVMEGPVSGSTDILDWMPDFSAVTCPADVCGEERFYALEDFRNGGGQVPQGGSIRAFAVVPIPAAAWLFASALGLLGWSRRR
ncbi:MAG: hypothetical protein JSV45_09010 [Chromatiales bacterium]|nr:MAG: hypothetical protein JSV45_09010 [Chromatiales bacterium]